MAFKEASKFTSRITMDTVKTKIKSGELFYSPKRPNYWEAVKFPKGIVAAK
jgi:hypothetical protein